MFDGVLQPQFPSRGSSLTEVSVKVSRPMIIGIVLALFGIGLAVLLPSDPSEGFHIEFIGP